MSSKLDDRYKGTIFSLCMDFITKDNKDPMEAIDETLKNFSSLITDIEAMRAYLIENISVSNSDVSSIICDENIRNRNWWNELKSKNENPLRLWERYKYYLQNIKGWSVKTIEKSINEPTDFVMNYISNPDGSHAESTYGAVFGYVQSGKTANYIGLINKALDAGYRVIIVLAGLHNNLRSQTQMRIDEEVLGFETNIAYLKGKTDASAIGVGKLPYPSCKKPQPLTSRDESGDYNKARAATTLLLDHQVIFIVKKQKTVLENIFDNFSANPAIGTDGQFSADYSLLIIDDEADQASVNTKYKKDKKSGGISEDESSVSTINCLIRSILALFKCSSYVGYTATPYANIFIPPSLKHDTLNEDLFPKDFIVSLPKPKGYIGALEFFGEDEESEIMPLVRYVETELDDFINIKNKSLTSHIPQEMKTAVLAFIIVIATRNLRGYTKEPNSMLIHVNRYNDIQTDLKQEIENYYDEISSYINNGDKSIIYQMKKLWEDDFVKTTEKMRAQYSSYMIDVIDLEWEKVEDEIKRIISCHLIKISEINGKSKDALCYKEARDEGVQFNVIAIGGDKLSRGLTLEGLSVSFFMRESKMYDTLMQMGRWFGFRPGYADLCRLYVPAELFGWFMKVSYATEDLRNQIAYMRDCGKTPSEFGLRVATNPEMLISSSNKIKTGTERVYTFSNRLNQTRSFDINSAIYDINYNAVEMLIKKMGDPITDEHWNNLGRLSKKSEHYFWENVDGKLISDFFENYRTCSKASKVNSSNISQYIKEQMKYGGLISWTVCLKNFGSNAPFEIAGLKVKSGLSRNSNQWTSDGEVVSVKALKSKDDEYFDFNNEDFVQIEGMKNQGLTDEKIRKELRTYDKGLLILCPLDENTITPLSIPNVKHKKPFGFIVVFPDNEGKGNLQEFKLNDVAAENGDFDD